MPPPDRRALKREYKESRRPMGVFQVRNVRNGKVMVSSSNDLPAIFNRVRVQLEIGSYLLHAELQRDWNDFGAEAFVFEVLEELEPYGERGYNRRKPQAR